MSYGLLGLKNQMETEAMQGLGDLAGQQRQNERIEDQMDAADHQQQMQAIGMGAGLGAIAGAQMGAIGGPMGMLIGAGVGYLASELF